MSRQSRQAFNHLLRIGICSVALGALSGCSGASQAPDAGRDAPATTARVEIGTGTVEFEPLADGDELILWAGPQGGHHFIVHARIQNLSPGDWQQPSLPENPTTRFLAFDEAGVQLDLSLPPYALGYRDIGDEWLYLPSGRFLRLIEAEVQRLFGTRVRIRVEVEDADGNTASDERWIVAVPETVAADAGPIDAPPADAGP